MEYRRLGRTELKVSVGGLGAGGGAALGTRDGKGADHAVRLVRLAHELGVNMFDTAKMYGTEAAVGAGIKGLPRDEIVVTTKSHIARKNQPPLTGDEVVANLDESLRLLGVDYVDVFQIHSLYPANYDHAVEVVIPALRKEQDKGKFRFLGATEFAQGDHAHVSLSRAIDEDLFDVVMVPFSMINQGARDNVFPRAVKRDVGTLLMFVSRNMFGYPERLKEKLRELAEAGDIPATVADDKEPLEFLIHAGGATSLMDLAYRYARDEPGASVVLFGTGDEDHLRANIDSLSRPPLPAGDREKINSLFGALVGVGIEPGMSRGGNTENRRGTS